jgi:hypothetical protein
LSYLAFRIDLRVRKREAAAVRPAVKITTQVRFTLI